MSEIEQQIKKKIENAGVPLKDWDIRINYGIKTGYNEAFIINTEKRDELVDKCPEAASIIRPILRGRDIRKYKSDWCDLWIINAHNGQKNKNLERINIVNEFSEIYSHLQNYSPAIEQRSDKGQHWTNLRNCAYLDEFDLPKIIYPGLMRISKNKTDDFPRFFFDENEHYLFTNDTYFMTGKNLNFLLALLNSNITRFLFPLYMYSFDTNGYKVFTEYLEKMPFIQLEHDLQLPFIELADKILQNKKKGLDSSKLERDLNSKIYQLYGFNSSEIDVIERC